MLPDYYAQQPVIDKLINHQIEEGIQLFDDVNFNYAVLSKNNPLSFSITSNIPEWYDNYKETKRQLTDPVVIRALTSDDDFYWDQKTMNAAWGDNRIFNDAKEFDIMSGHTFVIHDQLNNIAMLNVIQKTGSLSSFKKRASKHKVHLMSLLERCHVLNLMLRGVPGDILPVSEYCCSQSFWKNVQFKPSQETLMELVLDAGYAITKN